jgi:hypothetical protein
MEHGGMTRNLCPRLLLRLPLYQTAHVLIWLARVKRRLMVAHDCLSPAGKRVLPPKTAPAAGGGLQEPGLTTLGRPCPLKGRLEASMHA